MLNLSNLAWFEDSIALPQHLQISRMRALETQHPMLRATNTGATAIIDATGTVVAQLPNNTAGALDGNVQGQGGLTPFLRYGNVPALVLCVADARVCGGDHAYGRASRSVESTASTAVQCRRPGWTEFTDDHLSGSDPAAAGVLEPPGLRVCCSRSTWRSAPVLRIRRRSCGRSGPSRGAQPTCSRRAGRRTRATARIRTACTSTTSTRSCSSLRRPTYWTCTLARCTRSASTRRRTTSASSKTTGRTRRSALGSGLGSVDERHGDHAVHVLPAGRRTRMQADHRRDHLRTRAAHDVPAGCRQRVRPRLHALEGPRRGARADLRRRVPPERGRAKHLQLRGERCGVPAGSVRTASRPRPVA